MVAISESDDDDLSSNILIKKRKQFTKVSKNKIEDSESSSDENNEDISDINTSKRINNESDEDDDEETLQDNLVIDESAKLDGSCIEQFNINSTTSTQRTNNDSAIDDSRLNDNNNSEINDNTIGSTLNSTIEDDLSEMNDQTMSSTVNNNSTIEDDDNNNSDNVSEVSLSKTKDSKRFDENVSTNKKVQKRKGRTKLMCFDDSSNDDDDEGIVVETIPKDKKKHTSVRRRRTSKKDMKSTVNKTEEDKTINDDIDAERNVDMDKDIEAKILERHASNDEDIEAKIVEDDMFIENLMKNKEIYDAEDSDNETSKKKKESRKGKCRTKDEMKEAKSVQQRLLRQQKFSLPYHVPEVKPLKEFLMRVPVVKTKEKKRKQQPLTDEQETITIDNGGEVVEHIGEENKDEAKTEDNIANDDNDEFQIVSETKDRRTVPHIGNLFKQKPKLSFGNEESIEFMEFCDGDDDDNTSEGTKTKGVLDSFMERFEKHTKGTTRKNMQSKDTTSIDPSMVNVVIPEKEIIPGGRRIAFAAQMKLKIRKDRAKTLKELEKERKLLNEENTSEEEEEEFDDDDDDGGDEVDEDGGGVKEGGGGSGGAESSEDEELSKWNLDDERKALEVEMEDEEEKGRKVSDNNTNSIDFSTETQKSPERQEKDDIHWDDSSSTVSSVLPAGQGDPTGRKHSSDGRMTPFSKLVKSGLFDSTSNLNYNNNSSSQGPVASITLPCEDTQDLYKEDERNDEESQIVSSNFQLTLDEETLYTQVIDSQGFFNGSKKNKRRQLFDKDVEDGVNDFSHVIELCSGKFNDNENDTTCKSKDEMDQVYEKDEGFSMTQVIGLCSGKFSNDDDAITSTKNDRNMDEHDEGSLSNPPMEHPFSSRVNATSKSSHQFAETSESIFSLDIEKMIQPKLDEPLGLSDIIDDNFNDNAIDFCTAPFSGQATGKENTKKSITDMASSQTKFDVGNWLKKDTKMNGKDSGSGSNESINDDVHHDYHSEKEKGVEEDDVFADNEEDDGGNDDDDGDNDDDNDGDNDDDDGDNDDDGGNDDDDGGNNDDDGDNDDDDGEKKEKDEDVAEESEEEDDYDENEVNEELLEYQDAISLKKGKKWSKSAFYEKEAELSGSDVGSDAEELGSDYDEYEVDSDVETGLPTGDKLKAQVHKIHQQKILDQDQREVRLLQELYIGDRESGKKRQRNFKWRNVTDDDANVNAPGHSDDDVDELNFESNMSQKLERAEREKYISELEEREKATMDENSQSMLEMIKDPASFIAEKPTPTIKPKTVKAAGRVLTQKRSGSFMSQTKSSFTNLSSTRKTGGLGGKAFVFHATEAEQQISANKENKVVNRKTPSLSLSEPAKKRTKFNSHVETSESQSIFDLL